LLFLFITFFDRELALEGFFRLCLQPCCGTGRVPVRYT
jgi:hypothetical protein